MPDPTRHKSGHGSSIPILCLLNNSLNRLSLLVNGNRMVVNEGWAPSDSFLPDSLAVAPGGARGQAELRAGGAGVQPSLAPCAAGAPSLHRPTPAAPAWLPPRHTKCQVASLSTLVVLTATAHSPFAAILVNDLPHFLSLVCVSPCRPGWLAGGASWTSRAGALPDCEFYTK